MISACILMQQMKLEIWCGWVHPYKTIAKFIVHRIYCFYILKKIYPGDIDERFLRILTSSFFYCCKLSKLLQITNKLKHISDSLVWAWAKSKNFVKLLANHFQKATVLKEWNVQSKKKGKDQKSIQSCTTHDPGYRWESDNFTIRHNKWEPRGQPFPSRWPQGINKQTRAKA